LVVDVVVGVVEVAEEEEEVGVVMVVERVVVDAGGAEQ
jgi:hypothetical protein